MRSFLALDLPATLCQRLERLEERLRYETVGWRWARPGGIHLTLRFLGEVDGDLDRRSRPAWAAAARCAGPVTIRVGELDCFRNRRQPRVLWLSVQETGGGQRLQRLAQAVERAAVHQGFAPNPRPFRPHLTLARARRDVRATLPEGVSAGIDVTFVVEALTLFRSELHPEGARYTVLERFPLG